MEGKENQIKIGLWTYTALIVSIIILASSIVFGWYYLFIIKKADNSQIPVNQNKPSNIQDLNTPYIPEEYANYVYNEYTGYYDYNGSQYVYNTYYQTMQEVYNYDYNYQEPVDNIYVEPNSTTILTEKVGPQLSASTILKTLYINAYQIYNGKVGFEYINGEITNSEEILNQHLNTKAKTQYQSWEKANGRYLSSQLLNIKFKNINAEENKISATVVGDLLYCDDNILVKGLENKFSIEHNGVNWVVNEYEITDTYIRNYTYYTGNYVVTKLSEITDKFSVVDFLPDYLQTQDFQEDRYQKINYEIDTYENNSVRIIDLYHKNKYNKLSFGNLTIQVSEDKKSASVSVDGGEFINIENINGTIKKIFVGDIYEFYRPVILLEDGTVKIADIEYGKYYADTITGLPKIQDLCNATISSFIKNSNGDYELASEEQSRFGLSEPNCVLAIDTNGKPYKIELGGGY